MNLDLRLPILHFRPGDVPTLPFVTEIAVFNHAHFGEFSEDAQFGVRLASEMTRQESDWQADSLAFDSALRCRGDLDSYLMTGDLRTRDASDFMSRMDSCFLTISTWRRTLSVID